MIFIEHELRPNSSKQPMVNKPPWLAVWDGHPVAGEWIDAEQFANGSSVLPPARRENGVAVNSRGEPIRDP